MGEHTYTVLRRNRIRGVWEEVEITFSEDRGDLPCLCTFPGNYTPRPGFVNYIGKDTVHSLAVLGAVVALLRNSDEIVVIEHDEGTGGSVFIPGSVPAWILEAIDRVMASVPDDVQFRTGVAQGFQRGFEEGKLRGEAEARGI